MGLMLQSYIVTLLHYKLPTSAPESAKRNLKGLNITETRARCYGSLKLGQWSLKALVMEQKSPKIAHKWLRAETETKPGKKICG